MEEGKKYRRGLTWLVPVLKAVSWPVPAPTSVPWDPWEESCPECWIPPLQHGIKFYMINQLKISAYLSLTIADALSAVVVVEAFGE